MSPGRTISLVSVLFMIAIIGGLLVSAVVIALRGLGLILLGFLAMAAQFADPQVLAEAMRQADPTAQVQVIRDLGELGPDAEPYLGMLKERFEVGEPDVQAAALEALKKIDPERWEHRP